MLVNGVRVSEGGGMEMCHQFTFRYLIAKGLIKKPNNSILDVAEIDVRRLVPLNFTSWILGDLNGTAARSGRTIVVPTGGIVIFKSGPYLSHTMVADSTAYWAGTNNDTAFGKGSGRMKIGPMFEWVSSGNNDPGWSNDNNEWRDKGGGKRDVLYKALAAKTLTQDQYNILKVGDQPA